MNKLNVNWRVAASIAVVLFGFLSTTDSFARSLYKSVGADGKITYSNHPTMDNQSAKNVSLLKASPKFSLMTKQSSQVSKKS